MILYHVTGNRRFTLNHSYMPSGIVPGLLPGIWVSTNPRGWRHRVHGRRYIVTLDTATVPAGDFGFASRDDYFIFGRAFEHLRVLGVDSYKHWCREVPHPPATA